MEGVEKKMEGNGRKWNGIKGDAKSERESKMMRMTMMMRQWECKMEPALRWSGVEWSSNSPPFFFLTLFPSLHCLSFLGALRLWHARRLLRMIWLEEMNNVRWSLLFWRIVSLWSTMPRHLSSMRGSTMCVMDLGTSNGAQIALYSMPNTFELLSPHFCCLWTSIFNCFCLSTTVPISNLDPNKTTLCHIRFH